MKHALRQLAKSPGFTAVAVLSLALGIGANTAVFSLVNAVMLRLLPVRAPEELVLFNWISENGPRSGSGWPTLDSATGKKTSTSFSLHTFEQFRDHNATLAAVFAFAPAQAGFNLNVDGQPEIARFTQYASGLYHTGLGVTAAAGRLFTAADDQPSAPPVAVISYRYWQQRFAGDPNAIGRSVLLNNIPVTLIGVTAERFAGTQQIGEYTDITVPFSLAPRLENAPPEKYLKADFWWVRIMARLQPGVTLAQAQANLAGVFQETARGNLDGPKDATAQLRAEPGAQGLVEARRAQERSLHLLLGLVGLVLLIACVNVANLLLARGAARRREIAIRLALGASRTRVVQQLLGESVLLSALGAGLGLLFAAWGCDALLALEPLGPARGSLDVSLDLRVLAFTTAVAVLTGVLFGLVPALRATRLNLGAEFQGGTRNLGTGGRSTLAKSLMTVQVALSLVLLVGAGLFVRTLHNLQTAEVGFTRERLLQFQIDTVTNGTPFNQAAAFYDRVAARLAAIPGVKQAGYSGVQLLAGGSWTSNVTLPGGTRTPVAVNSVDPHFFATLELPIVAGRNLDTRDGATAPKVAVINQTLARKLFGDENPIGRRVGFNSNEPNTEIIGLVPTPSIPPSRPPSRRASISPTPRKAAAPASSSCALQPIPPPSFPGSAPPSARSTRRSRFSTSARSTIRSTASSPRSASSPASAACSASSLSCSPPSDSTVSCPTPCCAAPARSASAWPSARCLATSCV